MIQPIREQIVVIPFPADEISEGGIIVPDSAKERSCKATVVATGGGTPQWPMRFKKGDVIFHVKGAGTEIQQGGTKFYLMSARDVLSTLN